MRGSTLLTGIVILILCAGLATADYVLSEQPHINATQEEVIPPPPPDVQAASSSSVSSSVMSSDAMISSSKSDVVKKGVSTKKASNVSVEDILARLQLVPEKTGESGFLLLIAPDRSKVKTSVLLRNNDRAFLLSWIESDDVKTTFATLKQALQEQFSGKVTDLIDETRTSPNGPPVDYLSFMDPALSAEHIVFLRVRTRLYEIRIAENGQDVLEQLVAELSK